VVCRLWRSREPVEFVKWRGLVAETSVLVIVGSLGQLMHPRVERLGWRGIQGLWMRKLLVVRVLFALPEALLALPIVLFAFLGLSIFLLVIVVVIIIVVVILAHVYSRSPRGTHDGTPHRTWCRGVLLRRCSRFHAARVGWLLQFKKRAESCEREREK